MVGILTHPQGATFGGPTGIATGQARRKTLQKHADPALVAAHPARRGDARDLIPTIQRVLAWTYDNLRLSIIPFFVAFVFYCGSLWRLKQYLKDQRVPAEKIAQTEHLVDIWINLLFGIGVIWTAIGMRGALLDGLGDLNAQSAEKLGAFSILQRLVDGGILLALSTTIFGAVGGYLLRLVKSLTAGTQVKAYYNRLAKQQADGVHAILQSIDQRLSQMVDRAKKPPQDGR